MNASRYMVRIVGPAGVESYLVDDTDGMRETYSEDRATRYATEDEARAAVVAYSTRQNVYIDIIDTSDYERRIDA